MKRSLDSSVTEGKLTYPKSKKRKKHPQSEISTEKQVTRSRKQSTRSPIDAVSTAADQHQIETNKCPQSSIDSVRTQGKLTNRKSKKRKKHPQSQVSA